MLFNRCSVYLKYSCTKKRVKTCKNVQKRASQVLIYQKKTCKNLPKCAKSCKNVQKRAKTCISSIFGPNSKTCTCEIRAAWGRVSRGLTVASESSKSQTTDVKWQNVWKQPLPIISIYDWLLLSGSNDMGLHSQRSYY